MRPHVIFRYIGSVFLLNAAFLFISALISLYYWDSAFLPLLYSFIITALFGAFPLIFVPPTRDIHNKEGFLIVVASWLLSCVIGIIPYILWGGEFTLTNAWFESVSGYTTTGSTILTDIEALPFGILFWRSATHWIGGIGIIVFMLSVLPSMGSAGMVLYRSEMSSLAKESFRYRTQKTVKILIYVYVGLTVIETISLMLCGMNWFEAVIHSFGTVATGGFSPKNLSILHYRSLAVEVIILVFMVLSGIHFGLLFEAAFNRSANLLRSLVVRYYLVSMAAGISVTTLYLWGMGFQEFSHALRYSSFMIVSLGTSTGFANADTAPWPPFTQFIMIFFTLQCACAGSTSGGIKVDRVVIFWKAIRKRMIKIKHPSAVVAPKLNEVAIEEDLLESNVLYISLYIGIVFLSGILLTALGVDGLTALSGSAATMGNVGPGFGSVGSMDSFASIPDPGKWILSITMLLGRLEIFALALLFTIRAWR
jgi:trk system potassium uptake protein TrkH